MWGLDSIQWTLHKVRAGSDSRSGICFLRTSRLQVSSTASSLRCIKILAHMEDHPLAARGSCSMRLLLTPYGRVLCSYNIPVASYCWMFLSTLSSRTCRYSHQNLASEHGLRWPHDLRAIAGPASSERVIQSCLPCAMLPSTV